MARNVPNLWKDSSQYHLKLNFKKCISAGLDLSLLFTNKDGRQLVQLQPALFPRVQVHFIAFLVRFLLYVIFIVQYLKPRENLQDPLI